MTGLSEQHLAEIQARWSGSWMGEQYRLTITNTNRPGTTLDALSHTRTDVPALLAEVARLRGALSEATGYVAELEADLGDWSARVAELEAERHSTNEALSDAAETIRAKDQRIKGLEARLFQVGMARRYRLESGKDFVYVEDIRDAVLGVSDAEAGDLS